MKRFLTPALLFFFMVKTGSAQTYRATVLPAKNPVGEYVPSQVEREFGPRLIEAEAPKPGTQVSENELRALKKNIRPLPILRKKAAADTARKPILLEGFNTNTLTAGTPHDNSFAINRNGILISVKNTDVFIYDTYQDSILLQTTLRFFSFDAIKSQTQRYDPRVIYDPKEDRFIVLYMHGTTYQSSKIIAAFSKTSDPMDGFNFYILEGNPLDNNTWSDYPHITVGEDGLYITVNTFLNGSTNNSGYVESTIRMIDKHAAYDSLPVGEVYYSNLAVGGKNLFNFTGMQAGDSTYSGPAHFFSNRNLDTISDSLFLVEINEPLDTLNPPALTIKTLHSSVPYGLPPDARQMQNHRFDCNDSRIQGGFVQNGKIQMVGNTVNSMGHSSFYHGLYDLNQNKDTVSMEIIENDSLDFGYPNITWTGANSSSNEAIITVNHCGPNFPSGFSAIFYDDSARYSDPKIVVKGGGFVDRLTGSGGDVFYERWGDYSGAQPIYDLRGHLWASGYRSDSSGNSHTFCALLKSPTAPTFGVEEISQKQKNFDIFPNPVLHYFQVQFELEKPQELRFILVNVDGKNFDKKTLLVQDAYEGENTFVFRTEHLQKGLYVLNILSENGRVIKSEKVLKN